MHVNTYWSGQHFTDTGMSSTYILNKKSIVGLVCGNSFRWIDTSFTYMLCTIKILITDITYSILTSTTILNTNLKLK